MPHRQEHVNKVDWGLDLAAGEQSNDGDADLGFPEMIG
jgi:hypothetical protein